MMRTQQSELCFEAKFTYSVSKCAHPHFLFWKEPEPHFLHMKTQAHGSACMYKETLILEALCFPN